MKPNTFSQPQQSMPSGISPNVNVLQTQPDLSTMQQPQKHPQQQQQQSQQFSWDNNLHNIQSTFGSRGTSPSQTNSYMYLQHPLVDQTTQPSTPYNGTTIQNSSSTPQLATANAMPSIHLLDINPQSGQQMHPLQMSHTAQTHSQEHSSQYPNQLQQNTFMHAQMMQQPVTQQRLPTNYQRQHDQQSYSQYNTMQTTPMQQPQLNQNQNQNQNYSLNYSTQTMATTATTPQSVNAHAYYNPYIQVSNQHQHPQYQQHPSQFQQQQLLSQQQQQQQQQLQQQQQQLHQQQLQQLQQQQLQQQQQQQLQHQQLTNPPSNFTPRTQQQFFQQWQS